MKAKYFEICTLPDWQLNSRLKINILLQYYTFGAFGPPLDFRSLLLSDFPFGYGTGLVHSFIEWFVIWSPEGLNTRTKPAQQGLMPYGQPRRRNKRMNNIIIRRRTTRTRIQRIIIIRRNNHRIIIKKTKTRRMMRRSLL